MIAASGQRQCPQRLDLDDAAGPVMPATQAHSPIPWNRSGKLLARYAQAVAAVTVEVVARTSPHSLQVLRRRWVVERTFGWLMRYRRLARDYERITANSEAMIYWATVIIMTRRLACYEKRWGGERPAPPSKLLYLQAPRTPRDHKHIRCSSLRSPQGTAATS